MADKESKLSLVIRAVDKATAPIRAVNERIREATKPVRALNNSLRAMSDEIGIPKVRKAFGEVGKSIKGVGREAFAFSAKIAAMAAGASAAMFALVRSTVDAGDALGEQSERVGLTADAYAQLQYAAAQADVDQEAFASAMDKFNKSLGEAKAGGGSMLAFLTKAEPLVAKQIAGAQDTAEALDIMGRAFVRVTDPGKRAALAAAVFGKSGLQMGAFLGKGSAEISRLREEFFRLAGSQTEFASGAGALDEEMRRTETAFLGLRNAAAGALFPALTELAKAITEIVVGNRESLREWAQETGKELTAWVKSGGVKRLAEDLRSMAQSAKSLSDSLGGLQGVVKVIALIMGAPLISSVVTLGGALWKLGADIAPLLVKGFMLIKPLLAGLPAALGSAASAAAPFLAAAASLAAAGFAIYKNWDNLKELFTDFTGPGGLLSTLKEMLTSLDGLNPLEQLKTAALWWSDNLGLTKTSPPIGAAAAAPRAAAAVPAGNAHVQVDFSNLPPGARVKQTAADGTDLDTSLGYSMAVP